MFCDSTSILVWVRVASTVRLWPVRFHYSEGSGIYDTYPGGQEPSAPTFTRIFVYDFVSMLQPLFPLCFAVHRLIDGLSHWSHSFDCVRSWFLHSAPFTCARNDFSQTLPSVHFKGPPPYTARAVSGKFQDWGSIASHLFITFPQSPFQWFIYVRWQKH